MAKKKQGTALALAKRVQRLERVRPAKKKAPAPPPDTALAAAPAAVPAPGRSTMIGPMDEDIDLGTFGLAEIKATPEEIAVLKRKVDPADIRVLPNGAVYLPHIVYTRWLNDAFGIFGWALRPLSKPSMNVGGQVLVPYHLMIHGTPVAFALGEQDYHERNRNQSYGDAIESTHASALRRVCKHLGMALELWDHEYATEFLEQFAVAVEVEVRYKHDDQWKTKTEEQWRLRRSRPLKGEISGRRPVVREEARAVPAHASHAHQGEPITDAQLRRLHAIARNRGRDDDEVRGYLRSLGYASSRDVTRRDYDTVCTALEHPGALPQGAREPGMEG